MDKDTAQPAQELVEDVVLYHDDGTRIVRIAPQRPWVGLTGTEKHELRYSHMTSAEFIDAIEAKLKEKNNV